MAMCSRPSRGETPSEITLCESFADSLWGSVIVLHVLVRAARRATTALRSAVYQAVYW
jgi:hypothetical protein